MVDWDGKIVCTVFTNGCNFRCPFCHNAPLALGVGDRIDENEVFDYLIKRKNLVDGVCISGGEPTLQSDIIDFVKKVKELGFDIKLDTNGTNPDKLQSLLSQKIIDFVAMDIKNGTVKYAATAGISAEAGKKLFENVKKSIEIIKSSGVDYEFRTTLISEFHTLEDMEEIAVLIGNAKRYVLQKYVDRDGCIIHGYDAVDKGCAEKYLQIFDKVEKTGLRGFS